MPESSEPTSLPSGDRFVGEGTPIVAMGASAGGVEALRRFFGATPADGGVAYVVIVHPDPDHESQIAHILGRATAMPVSEVVEEMAIEPDHVYVISPKSQLEFDDGTLRVLPLSPQVERTPRDLLVGAALVPGRDGERKECVLTLLEIEQILAHARQLEEDAENIKVGFLATVSHELRTPLNAITGYAGLLLEGVPDALSEAQRHHVQRVRACSEQLAGMVEQVLTLTQLLEGGTPITPKPVDPRVPVQAAADLIGPEASRRELDLRTELPDEVSEIVTDPDRIRQILVNLAQNAVKYTKEGEVVLSLRQGEDGGVVFEVRDTGAGIAPEDQKNIFERFWQARHADRPVGTEGAGIGLSVANKLVHLLEGTIEVDSEVNRGSTFRVRLPASIEPSS